MMDKLVYQGDGERIDTYLTSQFPYARNFFHHIINRKGVKVKANHGKNQEKVIKKSYKLKSGDEIYIDDLQRYVSSEVLDEAPDIDIPVVSEQEDYLVLNKPKGVLSHPNSVWDIGSPSVVGFLYHRYKNLPTVGNFIRAGLIHRLDKETDGLMIIAKTEKGLAHFKALFNQKSEGETLQDKEKVSLQKFYRAKCHIQPKGQEFLETVASDELRVQKGVYYIQEMVVPKVPYPVPKMGITKILNYDIKDSMVDIDLQILTGRTHQIRFHLSEKGLPIVGDYLYGTEDEGTMMLTAYKLIFQDLDREIKTVEI